MKATSEPMAKLHTGERKILLRVRREPIRFPKNPLPYREYHRRSDHKAMCNCAVASTGYSFPCPSHTSQPGRSMSCDVEWAKRSHLRMTIASRLRSVDCRLEFGQRYLRFA